MALFRLLNDLHAYRHKIALLPSSFWSPLRKGALLGDPCFGMGFPGVKANAFLLLPARVCFGLLSMPPRIPLDDFFSISMGCGMDGQYNERALEWSDQIPPILRGLAFNPPLVMPYVGSMFKSDTAMLRPGTRYVQDLPLRDSDGSDALSPDPRSRASASRAKTENGTGNTSRKALRDLRAGTENRRALMPKAWREALETLDAIYATAAG